MKNDIVIIGCGHAGGMVAISLRKKGFNGSILMIGNETHIPYQRPPLSKAFLYEELNEKRLYLKSKEYYEKNSINILKNRRANLINTKQKFILLDNGDQYYYEKLVIASGSLPKKINIECEDSNIHYLRNIEDALAIKKLLKRKKSLAIIGAGYIGLEISASAINMGVKPIVIESQERAMARSVCKETSDFFTLKHQHEGVQFIFDASVNRIVDYGNQKKIIYDKNKEIIIDSIVIGIGIEPNIELARNSNLEINDGISVNEYGQTSDKNIFAAGDCTNHPSIFYEGNIRLESVDNAVEQAKVVASNLLGIQEPYNSIPWFWSHQYNIKLNIVGISKKHDFKVVEGDMSNEKFAVYYFLNQKLVCVEAVNNQKAFSKGKKAILKRSKISMNLLRKKELNIANWLNEL